MTLASRQDERWPYVVGERVAPPGKEVYAATHRHSGAGYVLKGYRAGVASDAERTAREWSAAQRVGDGRLVARAVDRRDDEDWTWIAFQAAPGRPLRRILGERGHLEASEVRRLGADLAEALSRLHEEGLVHSDLSPSNCVVTEAWDACLCDLGEVYDGLDASETLSFTPPYAAPERMLGRTVPASDVYGLGAILYEAWAGAPPPARGALPWPARCEDPALRRLICECLSDAPARRPSASDVARRLRRRPSAVDWRPAALGRRRGRGARRAGRRGSADGGPAVRAGP